MLRNTAMPQLSKGVHGEGGRLWVWIVGIALIGSATAPLGAQESGDSVPVGWRVAGLTAAAPGQTDPEAVLSREEDRHAVVQFGRIPTAAERQALEGAGVKLLRYLGDKSFFTRVRPNDGAVPIAEAVGLVAAFEIHSDWKLHPKLLRGAYPAYSRFKGTAVGGRLDDSTKGEGEEVDAVALYVIFHPDVNLEAEGVGAVERHGGMVRSRMRSINGAVIWLPVANVNALAGEDVVQWLEPPLPPLDVVNDSNRALTQADIVQAPPYDLDGTGINVMVYDGGYARANHVDFGGRLAVRDSSGLSDHATHVAGTVGGDGAGSGGQYRGMAPGVTIESYGFEVEGGLEPGFLYTDPGDLEADYDDAINTYGVVISNNSIGSNVASNLYDCDWEGDYGATSMLIDAIVRGSLGTAMRCIWANGNERGGWLGIPVCGNAYHTTAPPSCAKNHITVGAVNSNDDSMTSFSSWGPTDDGRIKPDVCAPGCQADDDYAVTSTSSSGGYTTMCGTSMACPTVTGLCALILQDFQAERPGEPLPRNATLKVLLAHNAVDLGNAGPDYKFGYGSVRVQDTIDFMRGGSFLESFIDQGEDREFCVNVSPGASSLKVTLAWDDPPGAVNTTPELVNDLDVVAISPDGQTTRYPWTLDPEDGDAPAVRTGPDRANNIVQVVVDNPEAGSWTIRVSGYAVPEGPQSLSLATTPEMQTCTGCPEAEDGSVLISADTPVDATLVATDPDEDPLTYIITSLPDHGSLTDPGAGAIEDVPYELVGGGNVVTYTPDPGYEGTDTLRFTASDETCHADEATFSIHVAFCTVPYSVIDLGAIGGEARDSYAYGLNDDGVVVGRSEIPSRDDHAFLWQDGEMTDLGTFGGDYSGAWGVNALSQVVGWTDTASGHYRAFIWDGGTMTELPTLGGVYGEAYAINATGQVVGGSATSGGPWHAFLWQDGSGVVDLGTLGGQVSEARAVNATGQIVGWSDLVGGDVRAFRWQSGQMTDLGTLGGQESEAYGINAAGQIVGSAETGGYVEHAFLWQDGDMFDLGTLDGVSSRAYGINAAGQVVGTSGNAFVWQHGVMSDLNDMIDLESDWSLIEAYGINVSGQIAGWGYYNGQSRAFLMVPNCYYTLDVTVVEEEYGSVVIEPDLPTYAPGTIVLLTAESEPDGEFVRWEGDVPGGSTTQNPLTITMDRNKSVTAVFEADHAPVAYNGDAITYVDVPVETALIATDAHGDPLDYIITALPTHGSLYDLGAGVPISTVPYTLADRGNDVRYTPSAGYVGTDTFRFMANDGLYDSNEAIVVIGVRSLIPFYEVIDLGTLGGYRSQAFGINETGDVVGWSQLSGMQGGRLRGFLWQDGVMTDIGPAGIPYEWENYAFGINAHCQVAGYAVEYLVGADTDGFDDVIPPDLATGFLWDNGTMTLVSSGSRRSGAYDVNDSGQVVGTDINRAFVWQGGSMTYITGEEYGNCAYGINEAGHVVGRSGNRAFLWQGGSTTYITGEEYGNCAYGINEAGHIVGVESNRAFLWTGGTPIDLGTLPGHNTSYAQDINDRGQVVGSSGNRAFLWANGQMVDLNDRVVGSPSDVLTEAQGINNAGQIVGCMGDYGSARAVLLVPAGYTLTVTQEGDGTVEVLPDWPTYPVGEDNEVILIAHPDSDQRKLKYWEIYNPEHPGDANYIVQDTNNPTTIIMDADREVNAVFGCALGTPLPALMIGAVLGLGIIRRRR